MNSSRTLFWTGYTAGLALLAAVAVYCFARVYPPQIFAPFAQAHSPLLAHLSFTGNAPSFFYSLALVMFICLAAGSLADAKRHCLHWTILAVGLELSQLSTVPGVIIELAPGLVADTTWQMLAAYWIRGVFDPLDILATIAGGGIGLMLFINYGGRNDEKIRK